MNSWHSHARILAHQRRALLGEADKNRLARSGRRQFADRTTPALVPRSIVQRLAAAATGVLRPAF